MFTDEEIQAAVEKLVVSSVRRPLDPLGARRTDVTFNDLQEAAAGVFLTSSNASFYAMYLGVQELLEEVAAVATLVEQLLTLIYATGRTTTPVQEVSALVNAHAALLDLERTLDKRQQSFRSIETVPAFQRFQSNITKFLTDHGPNVKSGGEIVVTPTEARAQLPTLVTQLESAHTELQRRVALLLAGGTDFENVNLPALVSRNVVAKARSVLADRIAELSAMTPTQRLEVLRATVLDLLSSKAVVKQFGSLAVRKNVLAVTGEGYVTADQTHPAQPAAVLSGDGPFLLREGADELDLYLNQPVAKRMAGSVLVASAGYHRATFTYLGGGLLAAGVQPGDVVYVRGGTPSRWVVASRTDSVITATGPIDAPAGTVSIEVWPTPTQTIFLSHSTPPEIRFTVDEPYVFQEDGNANTRPFRFLLDGVPVDTSLTIVLDGATADAVADELNANVGGLNVRAEAFFALRTSSALFDILQLTPTTARFTVLAGGVTTAVDEQVYVVSGANAGKRFKVTSVDGGLAFFEAELDGVYSAPVTQTSVYVETGLHRRVRLVCPDLSLAFSLRSTIEVGSGAANTVFGLLPGTKSQARPSSAKEVATDILAKTTQVSAQAELSTSVYTGTASTVPFDPSTVVFPQSISTSAGHVLRVQDGPNKGDYVVQSQADGTHATVTPIFPSAGSAAAVTMTVTLAPERVRVLSDDKTVDSRIRVDGPAALTLFGQPNVGLPASQYFALPSVVGALQEGDLLRFYVSSFQTPDETRTIERVEGALLTLDAAVPFTTWSFGDELQPPFAELQSVHTDSYATLVGRLSTWMAASANQARWYLDLNRFLQPLLRGQPTVEQVDDAVAKMNELKGLLSEVGATSVSSDVDKTLEFALEAYTTRQDTTVETLLQSFRDKGADRAIKLLLEGQFSAFFGLTSEGASYAGTLLEAMRALAQEDLPVRKVNRNRLSRQLLSTPGDDPDNVLDDPYPTVSPPAY